MVSTSEVGDDAFLSVNTEENYAFIVYSDANPPLPKAFYRLQSDYTPPLVP